jgi:hypothetical protein
MPITPNIIQTMKQTVKDSVLTASTDQAWRVTVAGPVAAVTGAGAGLLGSFTVLSSPGGAGSTVGARGQSEHPSVDRPRRCRRTMAGAAAIVRKNYVRVPLPVA